MELDSNNHSVFLMYYHLVLVVKYRSSSMPIKVPVQDLSRRNFLMFVKSYGKKCFGQEVFVC
ncbi:hypothetical protein BN988_00938 [Oceanobacillus picturae]|uniref:Transposase n=1 Tax=Oceanobacillus picturae TaxID=171693 RepID=W9AAE8_9BACI|nr:hypothetical protein BN988_00938 [Oceanobacillus picturae]